MDDSSLVSNEPSKLILTVVVCSYNRAYYLMRCLDALLEQTMSKNVYEILVVDNKSIDGTPELVAQYILSHQNVRYFREARQGLSFARNSGLAKARADWVAYVDDDGEVFPDFIQVVVETIKSKEFDAFGGVYFPKYSPGKPKWFRDDFASNALISRVPCSIPSGPFWFCGGICAFRRSALELVGGFPVNLGMSGQKLAYGEETLVQVRLHRAGYKLGFVPTIRMDHWVLPAKYRLWHFASSTFGEGRDSWRSHDQTPRWRPLLRIYGSAVKRCLIAVSRFAIAWVPGTTWRAGSCLAEILMAIGNAVGGTKGFLATRRLPGG